MISVMLGGTSLKARLSWTEGVSMIISLLPAMVIDSLLQDERREGPVTVIPNSIA